MSAQNKCPIVSTVVLEPLLGHGQTALGEGLACKHFIYRPQTEKCGSFVFCRGKGEAHR